MTCPICGRVMCDHSPSERGQSFEEMMADSQAPHIIDEEGRTVRVTLKEYEKYIGKPWKTYKTKKGRYQR